MKYFCAMQKPDHLGVVLGVVVISAVVGLALSLALFGAISYPIVGLMISLYCVVAIKSIQQPNERNVRLDEARPKYLVLVISGALCSAALLYGRQFEYMSLWGDVGVYVNAASHLRAGGTIPFSWQVQAIDLHANSALAMVGMINPAGEGLWQFHALPTWPAFMAISYLPNDGRPILAVLYSISVVLFYFVARDFSKDEKASALATALFASLPLLWHQALYPTAEMLLLTIFLSTLVVSTRLRNAPFFIGSGLFAYGTVHLGILLLAPVVGLLLLISSLMASKSERLKFAWIGLACGLASLLAYQFALSLSVKYSRDIVYAMFGDRGYLAYVACLAPMVATFPYIARDLLSLKISGLRRAAYWLNKNFWLIAKVSLAFTALVVFIQAYFLGWSDFYHPQSLDPLNSWSARVAYINHGFKSLYHLSIVNIFFASAGFGLVGFLLTPFLGKQPFRIKLLWAFTFAFVFILGIYRVDITNNYYASRYFLPVLTPSMLILAAIFLGHVSFPKYFVLPVIAVALFFNGATVGAGFFQGDKAIKDFLENKIKGINKLAVYGSDWLRYIVYSGLLNKNVSYAKSIGQVNEKESGILISDSNEILGGVAECMSYVERRIPWQITFPTSPELVSRNLCFYTTGNNPTETLDYGRNHWLVDGKKDFAIVASEDKRDVKIEIHSLGWWSTKSPFLNDMTNIKPRLVVCGHEFELVSLAPEAFVFKGELPQAFCKASFQTNTFVPAELGEGRDSRALGADIYAITMINS